MTDITGHTRIFGILADPIHHVKTPQGINRLLDARKFDGVMVPIHVDSEGLGAMVKGLRRMNNLGGFVVTVPHKTAMPALCDELTPAAQRIGAVNVVRRTADGRLVGGMLDGEGFVAGLRSAGIEPAGLTAYLAGAGGAASAIAYALAQAGVLRLTVANRTPAKAEELIARLKEDFPGLAMELGTDDPSQHDLVVNGTSLGLRDGDALPLNTDRLWAHQIVAEIIMEPAETPLLQAARAKGCRVHHGAPMLASQIALMAVFMGVPAEEASGT
ncbi:shikimate dehydrogenase [Variovorax sp. OV700]|jgi:shikimate dehydrogenase|uniref:shikimate dehydrogenase family protein n=1 Tax=Variovorax sp. OV700 TaxID=1882826 RepID=UPI00088ECD59|nr:shikimate dehydrogenase [Variovorax sp. OV700]SDH70782.1 shikimate dehydrogenase [Variovorax sp. OV700]